MINLLLIPDSLDRPFVCNQRAAATARPAVCQDSNAPPKAWACIDAYASLGSARYRWTRKTVNRIGRICVTCKAPESLSTDDKRLA